MSNIYVKTFGCSFNQLDSEIMSGKLNQANFNIVNTSNNADLILINSCTVKNLSETKFFSDIKRYQKEGKKLILSGCITQAEESYLTNQLKGISVIGTNDLEKIVFVAKQTLNDNPIQMISKLGRKKENEEKRLLKEQLRLKSPKLRKNPIIEIIPINEGCLNTCSFCKTKQARGHLFSYSIESIKENMQNAINGGAKEIYLTSQDTGCYGFDIGTNLPQLLKELLTIKGNYKIRIGMGNPNHFKKIIDEILDIMLKDDRIYKFLHIPMQAGSNRILNDMKRMYTIEEFEDIIFRAKIKIPNITIANDIIVAYGNETNEEFQETIRVLQKVRTNVLNYSRFWLRPGTPAEKMYKKEEFIKGDISKERLKSLKTEFEKIAEENNNKWLNWEGEVLVYSDGKEETMTKLARNDYYKNIIILDERNVLKIGDIVKIKIIETNWKSFKAILI